MADEKMLSDEQKAAIDTIVEELLNAMGDDLKENIVNYLDTSHVPDDMLESALTYAIEQARLKAKDYISA